MRNVFRFDEDSVCGGCEQQIGQTVPPELRWVRSPKDPTKFTNTQLCANCVKLIDAETAFERRQEEERKRKEIAEKQAEEIEDARATTL